MLEIKFDPSALTCSQREDLASFILGWDAQSAMTVTPVTSGTLEPGAKIVGMADAMVAAGTLEPGMVLNVVQLPKSAPLSADAGQSSTAPVDTQVNTLAGIAPLPPVPQPVFPANTAAPQSPNLAEVDSKGIPWNARIHSSSRAKVADGSWKYRRGVSDEEVRRVEAELRGAAHDDVAALFTAPAATEVKTGEVVYQQPGGTVSGIAPPPPLGALPAMSGVSEPDLRKEFAQLMIRVAQAKGANTITAEEVNAILAEHGVVAEKPLPLLSTKLDLVPSVAAAIDEIIASRG